MAINRAGQIPLSGGKAYAIVDSADVSALSVNRWYLHKSDSKHYYAVDEEKRYMHRVLLGLSDPKAIVDHIDGNGLNNTRANIRVVSTMTNVQRGNWSAGIAGLKGAQHCGKKWEARIRIGNGKRLYLGRFDTPEQAHNAYLKAKEQYHGD